MLNKILILLLIATISYSRGFHISKRAYNKFRNIRISKKHIEKVVTNLEHLSADQILIMRKTYQFCKQYDLSYSCMAISYKESRFGDYLFNTLTGDYGIMGINLKEYIRSNKLKLSYWGKKKLAS